MQNSQQLFKATEDFLYALRNAGSKYSLDRMRKMCALFDDCQNAYPILHVAGTNGKGSVCAMLEAIIRERGNKTGMFTSPHLVYLGERVQVDRTQIERDEIISTVAEIRAKIAPFFNELDTPSYPSFFEYMTMLAFMKFAREKVDCAVVEVGLGGRLDSTNVVCPQISIITSIGLDHTQILGDTIAKIAREKAGIIKEGTSVVCGFLPPEAMAVMEEVAKVKHATLYKVQDYFKDDSQLPKTSLYGYYQRRNAAVATLAIRVLRQQAIAGVSSAIFKNITDNCIENALNHVQWAARWQSFELSNGARLILDSSHNEEGARTLDSNLQQLCQKLEKDGLPKPVISVGVLGRERAVPLFKVIEKYARKIILLVPNQPRALDFKALRDCVGECKIEIEQMNVGDLYKGDFSCSAVSGGDTIVCTGSIYLAGEVLAALGKKVADGLQDLPY